LTSALDEGERSVSLPCRFTPGERAPNIHWIGSWMDSRIGLIFLSNVQEEKLNVEIHKTIIFPLFYMDVKLGI
jgi:hypothetical protein